MGRGSDISVDNVDQYESLQEILRFLNKRCLVKTAHDCLKQVTFEYEDEFGECDRCGNTRNECHGDHDDDPYDRYDMYNDEADFE